MKKLIIATIFLISGKCFAQVTVDTFAFKAPLKFTALNAKSGEVSLPVATSTASGAMSPEQVALLVTTSVKTNATEENVKAIDTRVKALEANPSTGGGKQVNTSTYTITNADNGSLLIITTACTITISTGLKAGFSCTVKRIAGDVRYTGSSLFSYANWRRSSRQYENVYVESDGINNYLSGNLKL